MKRFLFGRKNGNDGVNREVEFLRIDVNINGVSLEVKVFLKFVWLKEYELEKGRRNKRKKMRRRGRGGEKEE